MSLPKTDLEEKMKLLCYRMKNLMTSRVHDENHEKKMPVVSDDFLVKEPRQIQKPCQSHPTVGVAVIVFTKIVPGQLSYSCEELSTG